MKSFKFNLTAVTAVTRVNVFELKEKKWCNVHGPDS
jgi:hypothetical protein